MTIFHLSLCLLSSSAQENFSTSHFPHVGPLAPHPLLSFAPHLLCERTRGILGRHLSEVWDLTSGIAPTLILSPGMGSDVPLRTSRPGPQLPLQQLLSFLLLRRAASFLRARHSRLAFLFLLAAAL